MKTSSKPPFGVWRCDLMFMFQFGIRSGNVETIWWVRRCPNMSRLASQPQMLTSTSFRCKWQKSTFSLESLVGPSTKSHCPKAFAASTTVMFSMGRTGGSFWWTLTRSFWASTNLVNPLIFPVFHGTCPLINILYMNYVVCFLSTAQCPFWFYLPFPSFNAPSQVWIASGVWDVFTWHLARNLELHASLGRTERSGPVDQHLRGGEQVRWPNPRNHPLSGASESTKWGTPWSCWWQAGVQTLPCRCPTLITFNHCHDLSCSDCQKLQAMRIIIFGPKLYIIWVDFLSQHRFRFWGGAHSSCCAHQRVPAGARVCEVSKAGQDRGHETRRESRQGHCITVWISMAFIFEMLYMQCFESLLIDLNPHRWARFQSILSNWLVCRIKLVTV